MIGIGETVVRGILVYRCVMTGGVITDGQQIRIIPDNKVRRSKNISVTLIHDLSKLKLGVANRGVPLFPPHTGSVCWIEHRPINVMVAWNIDDLAVRNS